MAVPPLVITGITTGERFPMAQPGTPVTSDRTRLSVEVSPMVLSHLDHISDVTGQAKAAIVSAALLDALPELLARADGLKRRFQEINQAKRK